MLFSDSFKRVISIAQALAKDNGNASVAPAHLLSALLHKDIGLEPFLTDELDVDVYYLKDWAEVRLEECPKKLPVPINISVDEQAEPLIEEADMVRVLLNQDHLEPVHLLVAVSTPGVGYSFDQLRTFPLQRNVILEHLSSDIQVENSIKPDNTDFSSTNADKKIPTGKKSNQAILTYCIDKTLLAENGKIDPVIGREKEVRTLSEILGRRLKPNVIIIGEPGVGKTALVSGLCLAVLNPNQHVAPRLTGAKIFELDNGVLVAGASYKGEVEDRFKNIIKELKQIGNAILFIDEIHVLMDKNGPFGGVANLLKPELAQGDITIIGATTNDEYRKNIEIDEAFARRFETLKVEEPDDKLAEKMLVGTLPLYVQHHNVEVPTETTQAAIRYARRYVKDRRLPDAAIDLLDRSMSALNLLISTAVPVLDSYFSEYGELKKDKDATVETLQWHYQRLKAEFNTILWNVVNKQADIDFEGDKKSILKQLDALYKRLKEIIPFDRKELTDFDLASIVAERTGIPLGKIQTQEKDRLLQMPNILKERVVGQDAAIESLSEAVLESRAGLGKPGQPIGSFFFLGPTGTGKTETAKALADFLFQSEANILRFDMSEFKEEHSAALLYGAPPGYVGYEEGGLLVNKIRQQPYSIVLFDEIEKAHSSVFDIFLQILDEGRLHDKLGKEGDFSNAMIIFTSNIGSQFIVDSFNKGKVPDNAVLLEKMTQYFRPEFLGRITEIVPFAPMTQIMVENILRIQLKSLYASLEKQQIGLEIDKEALSELAVLGFNPQYGARPLNGVIRTYLRRPLARKIISGILKGGDTAKLTFSKKNGFEWK
ncbi:MAG: type VI secretion system ATPase ClpV [Pseudopedobacter saltans]|uniref:Type VI secretion system ATPase ClpV n=1 Tax=Pseudopedobacter saltans TaxID=151895 RepID=A0A2W5ESA7_9SPHI|nr:MAG: type VI secretion system ATPase ClpV [Pseudopedobacter saltans]